MCDFGYADASDSRLTNGDMYIPVCGDGGHTNLFRSFRHLGHGEGTTGAGRNLVQMADLNHDPLRGLSELGHELVSFLLKQHTPTHGEL
jgi:hypothetical protein